MICEQIRDSLAGFGYRDFKEIEDGTTACLAPFLFTWAIVDGVSALGYRNRWCYENLNFALAAFEEWNGVGEPSSEGLTRKV